MHSYYRSGTPSGENVVVEAEIAALRRAGHDVELFAARTDDLQRKTLYEARSALRVATGIGANPAREIERFQPDVVRIHNLFPNLGRRWVAGLAGRVQVVLHNYRSVCANAMLLRSGRVCTDCVTGSRWSGVRYGCYRDSRMATLPLAWAGRRGPAADPVVRRADQVIVLSEMQRSILVDAGIPAAKVEVWHNFLPDELDPGPSIVPESERNGWLFVGRIDEEKGLLPLINHWPAAIPLTVIGTGPLLDEAERVAAGKQVTLAGRLARAEVLARMSGSIGLVFASKAPEALPLVYLEALATGTPVLAAGPNVVRSLVEVEKTGVAVEDVAGVTTVVTNCTVPAVSVAHCRRVFDEKYSEAVFLRRFGDADVSEARKVP